MRSYSRYTCTSLTITHTQAAIPHMEEGASITFNASINMAVGHPELVDYTATKGAMVGFMRPPLAHTIETGDGEGKGKAEEGDCFSGRRGHHDLSLILRLSKRLSQIPGTIDWV